MKHVLTSITLTFAGVESGDFEASISNIVVRFYRRVTRAAINEMKIHATVLYTQSHRLGRKDRTSNPMAF